MNSGFMASTEGRSSGMLHHGLQATETPDLKACACGETASCLHRSCRNTTNHSNTVSLYDEQELSSFQELLDRSLQELPSAKYPPPSATFRDEVSQKRAVKSIALIVPKLLRKFSSSVRSISKASSPCQIRSVAATGNPPQNKAGKAGAVIHEHHVVHHHHVYHVRPHATGGDDSIVDVRVMNVQAAPPVRRHSSSDSHFRGLVPAIKGGVPPAARIPPRRRRFSYDAPRPLAPN